jgi:hypothetical protein
MADETVKVRLESGEATVDAMLVAEGLRLNPEAVPGMIRDGTITCAFERGIDDDEGKHSGKDAKGSGSSWTAKVTSCNVYA